MHEGSFRGRGLLGEDLFIDAGHERRLRAMLAGQGDDLIVLEAGLGASGLYWARVHAAISQHARVVAYERAGFGASDPAHTQPRDLAHLADDLQTVVHAIPHRRLVLVGHSWGGPIVRVLAARYLAQGRSLAGLVLVDQSDENAAELYNSTTARRLDSLQNALVVPLAYLRLLAPLMRAQLRGLSGPLLDAVVASSCSADAARAIVAENQHVGRDLQRLRDNPLALGDVGISVVSGQQSTGLDRKIRMRLVRAHQATVVQHPGARYVKAENSGHMVPITEPEVVVLEALRFLEKPSIHNS